MIYELGEQKVGVEEEEVGSCFVCLSMAPFAKQIYWLRSFVLVFTALDVCIFYLWAVTQPRKRP